MKYLFQFLGLWDKWKIDRTDKQRSHLNNGYRRDGDTDQNRKGIYSKGHLYFQALCCCVDIESVIVNVIATSKKVVLIGHFLLPLFLQEQSPTTITVIYPDWAAAFQVIAVSGSCFVSIAGFMSNLHSSHVNAGFWWQNSLLIV